MSVPLSGRSVRARSAGLGEAMRETSTPVYVAYTRVSTVEKHLMKAVEQCDRYVRERTDLRPSNATSQEPEGRVREG